jgi:hypothetical protein
MGEKGVEAATGASGSVSLPGTPPISGGMQDPSTITGPLQSPTSTQSIIGPEAPTQSIIAPDVGQAPATHLTTDPTLSDASIITPEVAPALHKPI